MKKVLSIIAFATLFIACKEDVKKEETIVINDSVEVSEIESQENTTQAKKVGKTYPENLQAVFKAHGGLNMWKKMNNLCYEIEGRTGDEIHTIDLNNRKVKIENKKWSIGYDGDDVWLLQNEPEAYKGNARFYHNLYYYFYAMPFILADEGTVYSNIEPTKLDGKIYNGVKVGYQNGVGDSPKDEYIIYYDPATNLMSWLGYTVTYSTNEKSNDWHFIKYDDWKKTNGLLLPEKLTWYNAENNLPTSERNDMKFKKVTVSDLELESSVFSKPKTAVVVEK